jgi:hypothetical protein
MYNEYVGDYNKRPGFERNTIIEFPWLPNLLYKPNLSFYRAEHQQCAFYVKYCHEGYLGSLITMKQQGVNRLRVKADKKSAILQELDRLNINEKTIYGDLDHIASYIKHKYFGNKKTPSVTINSQSAFGRFDNTTVSGEEILQFIAEHGDKNIPIIIQDNIEEA